MKTISDYMIDVLRKHNKQYVGYADLLLMHECATLSGMGKKRIWKKYIYSQREHPLNIFQKVLNALDRSNDFEKYYYNLCVGKNGSEKMVRLFKVKDEIWKQKTLLQF